MVNKILTILLIAVVVIAIAAIFYFGYLKVFTPKEESMSVEGEILDVALSAKVITIKKSSGELISLALVSETKLFGITGNAKELNYFQKGFYVMAIGKATRPDSIIPSEVRILKEPNIIVFSPQVNEIVGGTLTAQGIARVFENQFNVRIVANGKKEFEKGVMANAPDAGLYGSYETKINIAGLGIKDGEEFTLEAFDYSAKDGSEIDKVVVSLKYKISETTKVKIYFNNNKLDPEISCNKVFPVEREVSKTVAVAKAALEQLLEGPTETERNQQYLTSINSGVKIQKLIIENNIAKVDFDETLEKAVGGSCRVSAIRAQITETLKQFPTIKSVIISINGRTEDVLQP